MESFKASGFIFASACRLSNLFPTALDFSQDLASPVETLFTSDFLMGYAARLPRPPASPVLGHGERLSIISFPFGFELFFGKLLMQHIFYSDVVRETVVCWTL